MAIGTTPKVCICNPTFNADNINQCISHLIKNERNQAISLLSDLFPHYYFNAPFEINYTLKYG